MAGNIGWRRGDREHSGAGMLNMTFGAGQLTRRTRVSRRRPGGIRARNRYRFRACQKRANRKNQEAQQTRGLDLEHINKSVPGLGFLVEL